MTTNRRNFSKAPDKHFGTSANSIPISNRRSRLSVSNTFYGTSTNTIPVSGKKTAMLANEAPIRSTNNQMSDSSSSRFTEKNSTTFGFKASYGSVSNTLNGTGGNSIPVSSRENSFSANAFQIKKNPMSASNTLHATSANAIPVVTRKPMLSTNAFPANSKKISIPIDKTFAANNDIQASIEESLSSVINSLKDTSKKLAPVKMPVKVDQSVCNSGNVKPMLSTNSNRSHKKLHNSDESVPFIVSELVGKYIGNQKHKTIIVKDFEWRRLYEPNLEYGQRIYFDLKRNMETFEHNPLHYERIDPILKYILETAKEGTSLHDAVQGCELVTRRGILVKIATFNTLDYFYNSKLYCQLVFQKFNGVIFACENLTEETCLTESNASKKQKQRTYWCHKFEQYMTTEFPNDKPNLNKPVSTSSQKYGVFKAQITGSDGQKLSTFISAEMDASDGDGNFVEFKIANQRSPKHREINWGNVNKSKWWVQCAFADVKSVFVGMHNDNGIVTEIRQLHVPREREDCNQEQQEWKQENCVDFLVNFIDEVRKLLDSKSEGALLKVDFFVEPQKDIKTTWVADNERAKYEFLLPQFTERFTGK